MLEKNIALGTFDGVHIGHRAVLCAAAKGEYSLAIAFKKPPKAYFTKKGIMLTDIKTKTRLIKGCGIKEVVYLDFEKVKDISCFDFFNYILKEYNPTGIFCGENYTFGKNAQGNVALLKELCLQNGVNLTVCKKVNYCKSLVSSSRIRKALEDGDIAAANGMLSEPFSFTGRVLKGNALGRTIGFPTVNVKYPKEMQRAKSGVYASVTLYGGREYFSLTDIGVKPTFGKSPFASETYILGFSEDIYGKTVRVYLKEYLREEKAFNGVSELIKQLEKDKAKITHGN